MVSIYLALGLLILPVIWFLTDPRSLKERIEHYLSFKGIILLIIEFNLVYFNFSYSNTLSVGRISSSLILSIGVILYLLGLALAIWAKITMGTVWGSPGEHNIKRQNKLIKSGPFKFTRNPIYLGLILTFLGYSLALRSVMVILNLFIIRRITVFRKKYIIEFFYYSVVKEEKILEKHFGKEYLEYKSKVPRFF